MFIGFFLLWILLNGNFALKTILLGIAFSAVLYLFLCVFFGFNIKKDIKICKNIPIFIAFVFMLIISIIIANAKVMKVIIDPKDKPSPDIVEFKTDIKSNILKSVLANSITITPGTISVYVKDDIITVHCLKKVYMDGFENSCVYKLIKRMDK